MLDKAIDLPTVLTALLGSGLLVHFLSKRSEAKDARRDRLEKLYDYSLELRRSVQTPFTDYFDNYHTEDAELLCFEKELRDFNKSIGDRKRIIEQIAKLSNVYFYELAIGFNEVELALIDLEHVTENVRTSDCSMRDVMRIIQRLEELHLRLQIFTSEITVVTQKTVWPFWNRCWITYRMKRQYRDRS